MRKRPEFFRSSKVVLPRQKLSFNEVDMKEGLTGVFPASGVKTHFAYTFVIRPKSYFY